MKQLRVGEVVILSIEVLPKWLIQAFTDIFFNKRLDSGPFPKREVAGQCSRWHFVAKGIEDTLTLRFEVRAGAPSKGPEIGLEGTVGIADT